jgi:hypothetical protein
MISIAVGSVLARAPIARRTYRKGRSKWKRPGPQKWKLALTLSTAATMA